MALLVADAHTFMDQLMFLTLSILFSYGSHLVRSLVPFDLPLGAPKPAEDDVIVVPEVGEAPAKDRRTALLEKLTDASRVVLRDRLGIARPAAAAAAAARAVGAHPFLSDPASFLQRVPMASEEADRMDSRPVIDLTDPALMFRRAALPPLLHIFLFLSFTKLLLNCL